MRPTLMYSFSMEKILFGKLNCKVLCLFRANITITNIVQKVIIIYVIE